MSMIVNTQPAPIADVAKLIKLMTFEDVERLAMFIETERSNDRTSKRKVGGREVIESAKYILTCE